MRRLLITTAIVGTLVLGALPAAAGSGHLEGYIPAVSKAEGLFGSSWTTDVWIYQQGATVIHLWFNPQGRDNTDGESIAVELTDPVVQISDIVGSFFGAEGTGSVHYLADGPVTVTSRTWTSSPDGGSYGQTIPGIPVGRASLAGTGQGGALRMLVDRNDGARANLGVVNVSTVTLDVEVEIFTADGDPAPGFTPFEVTLKPFSMRQIGDVLSRLAAGEFQGLIVRVGVTSDSGAILAYLSEVDNATNDASYQEAFRFAF